MPIRPRQTFLMKSGPSHDPERPHLHVVCFDADDKGNTLIVCVESYRNSLCDPACILEAGEHETITHKSYVQYRRARIEKVATLQAGIDTGEYISKEDMCERIFLKIRNGVGRSGNTSRKIKKYFKSRM